MENCEYWMLCFKIAKTEKKNTKSFHEWNPSRKSYNLNILCIELSAFEKTKKEKTKIIIQNCKRERAIKYGMVLDVDFVFYDSIWFLSCSKQSQKNKKKRNKPSTKNKIHII